MTVGVSGSPTVGQTFTATAAHAGPGCKVTFTFQGQSQTATPASGSASVTFNATQAGTFPVSAQAHSCDTPETAQTTVTVRAEPTPTPPKPQKPGDPAAKPPKKVKRAGTTVVAGKNPVTNTGQRIRTRVYCSLVAPMMLGERRYCKVIRGPKGQVKVKTFGIPNVRVTVIQTAPKTKGFKRYYKKTVYINGRKQ